MRARAGLASGLLLTACSTFGTAGAPPDGGVARGDGLGDGGANGTALAEASSDAGVGECVDFTTSKGSFETAGEVDWQPGVGFSFELVGRRPEEQVIFATFNAPSDVERTIVDVDLTVEAASSTDTFWMNGVTQYLASSRAFNDSLNAANAIQQGPGGILVVEMWPQGGANPRTTTGTTLDFAKLNGHVVLDTRWSKTNGELRIETPGRNKVVPGPTLDGQTSKSLTIEIGGNCDAKAPSTRFVVRSACVRFASP